MVIYALLSSNVTTMSHIYMRLSSNPADCQDSLCLCRGPCAFQLVVGLSAVIIGTPLIVIARQSQKNRN